LWIQSSNGGAPPEFSWTAAETPGGNYSAVLQEEQLPIDFDFDFDSVLQDPLNVDNSLQTTESSNDASLLGIQAHAPLTFHHSLQPTESSNDIAISSNLQATGPLSSGSQVASTNGFQCNECHEIFAKPYLLK